MQAFLTVVEAFAVHESLAGLQKLYATVVTATGQLVAGLRERDARNIDLWERGRDLKAPEATGAGLARAPRLEPDQYLRFVLKEAETQ